MDDSKGRPGASIKPPNLNQSKDLLQKLLNCEIERLDVAMRIERERKIVFPETSVIIHDILKIQNAIEKKDSGLESELWALEM